ncbi:MULTISPECIES: Ger(x)C family spore germination protein [unclassified Rummeliibacillus]|uniref:Ger(x)C family spore germination protein n=1 Tax=unclassified Rummeliibacillus TaxID=2622809 RepID=UPI000E66BCFB|nr:MULTISPECIES: Ger(x)C family spore germination protein [unclassified Rummeliibacillus]RIJ65484.1 Ger(x)C family spore germination protein [Rummeliibacillus sp. POC4]RPJ94192.1 Ger(x)C family spore germination protein [Rummeliibacillus sp. TYF005]
MRQVTIVCLCSVLLLAGCWDERLYKNLSVISVAGFEGHMGELVSYYVYPNSASDPTQFTVIETKGVSPRDTRNKADMKMDQTIDLSELTVLLIAEETAHDDIYPYLDVYYRNPQNPINSKIAITKGSPKDFLSIKEPLPSDVGEFYENFIESMERDTIFPKDLDLQQAGSRLFDEGIDLAIPYLKKDEAHGTPIAAGLALFNQRKFTGTILNTKESLLLNLLAKGKSDTARMTFLYEEDDKKTPLTIDIIRLKKKIKQQGNSKRITINVKIEVNIDEFPSDHLGKEKIEYQLEKFLSKKIQNNMNKMIKKCQDASSDPIGIGRKVRAKGSNIWKEGKWKDTYSTLDIQTNVDVKIIRSGILK